MPPKCSITRRLRADCGRSVGVTSRPTGFTGQKTHTQTSWLLNVNLKKISREICGLCFDHMTEGEAINDKRGQGSGLSEDVWTKPVI